MSADTSVMNRHLLLQLGDRLRALRKARGMTAEQMAEAAGITRKTLRSVEAGDPTPAIGTYLRVMAVLGINGELALLAGDMLSPPLPGSAAARSKRPPPAVKVEIGPSAARHQTQDLLSMALHEAAVRLVKKSPELTNTARDTLARWMHEHPSSRSMSLWREWASILESSSWQKVMASTARAQQLRQASPLAAVVPEPTRRKILQELADIKSGVVLESPSLQSLLRDAALDNGRQDEDGQPPTDDTAAAGPRGQETGAGA